LTALKKRIKKGMPFSWRGRVGFGLDKYFPCFRLTWRSAAVRTYAKSDGFTATASLFRFLVPCRLLDAEFNVAMYFPLSVIGPMASLLALSRRLLYDFLYSVSGFNQPVQRRSPCAWPGGIVSCPGKFRHVVKRFHLFVELSHFIDSLVKAEEKNPSHLLKFVISNPR
jgi:hypothetical protein